MKKYKISYSEKADKDISDLFDAIVFDYKEPDTAFKYVQGLIKSIEKLSTFPEAYSIRNNHSLLKYGLNVRRINYKKMAIIYTIHSDVVFIRRIIPSSMI